MADRLTIDPALLKRLERLSIVARSSLSARGPGRRETRNKGGSLEFHEYRHYAPGDELRYVDWNVYARHDSLFVKEFTAEENIHVAILLDCSASMGIGKPSKLEIGRILAVMLGYMGLASFDTVSLWRFSDRLEPVRSFLAGKTRIHDLIDAVEGIPSGGSSDFAKALGAPLTRLKGRSVAILLSDFYDAEGYASGLVHLMNQQIQIDLFQIVAREEIDPHLEGRTLLRDAETGLERELFLSSSALQGYHRRYRRFLEDLESFARSREIRMIRVVTDESLEAMVARAAQQGFLERV